MKVLPAMVKGERPGSVVELWGGMVVVMGDCMRWEGWGEDWYAEMAKGAEAAEKIIGEENTEIRVGTRE